MSKPPIDWNEVTVGETEIERTDGLRVAFKIMAIDGDTCWCKDEKGEYYTHKKDKFEEFWTIYDPWVDVSHECEIDDNFNVLHDGRRLMFSHGEGGEYKRGPGLRVWKRKGG